MKLDQLADVGAVLLSAIIGLLIGGAVIDYFHPNNYCGIPPRRFDYDYVGISSFIVLMILVVCVGAWAYFFGDKYGSEEVLEEEEEELFYPTPT